MPFAANSQKLMLAGVQAQAQLFKAAMSFQVEALQFLQRRCEMHVKFIDQLVESEQLDEAVEAFTGFVQDAATDYAEGAAPRRRLSWSRARWVDRRVRPPLTFLLADASSQVILVTAAMVTCSDKRDKKRHEA